MESFDKKMILCNYDEEKECYKASYLGSPEVAVTGRSMYEAAKKLEERENHDIHNRR